MIALLVTITAVFSVINAMCSIIALLQSRDALMQGQQNALLLQQMTTQLNDARKIQTVEIDQPRDNPVPVTAVQAKAPTDRPER